MGRGDQSRKFHEALCEELIAFAEQEFRDSRVKADGSTEKQHHEGADRIRAGLPKRKATPEPRKAHLCPPEMIYLWNWFVELLSGASGGGSGPTMLAWVDIQAWMQITGEQVEPWESRMLLRLSVIRADIEGEEIRKAVDGAKGQNRPHRPVGKGRR